MLAKWYQTDKHNMACPVLKSNPRLRKTGLSTVKPQDVHTEVFAGEKKLFMPKSHSSVGVLPLKVFVNNDSSK